MSVRTPITAGLFYPLDETPCREQITAILQDQSAPAGHNNPADTPAVLFPHAAWEFIAPLLAAGFQSLAPRRRNSDRIRHLLLPAPVHRGPEGCLFLPRETDTSFDTPLGPLPIRLPDILTESPPAPFRFDGIPHDEEHGIEMILPFLRRLYPKASLVPLLIGRDTPRTLSAAARILGPWYRRHREETLLVGTGNLSAFAPFPDGDPPDPPEDGCFQAVRTFVDTLLQEGNFKNCRARRLDAYPSPEDPYQHKKIWYGTILWEESD